MKANYTPTKEECLSILRTNGTPDHVIRQCLAVADAASRIGRALLDAGVPLDVELIAASALLHDISRTEAQHARTGAELLRKLGFERIAKIVSRHMEHRFQG
jgi:putative nucleotidyltransferase with HDIG domain